MTYDPDPGRRGRRGRKGKVPPQLRAWVYRNRRQTHDPRRKGTAKGYGKVRGKPSKSWQRYFKRPTKHGIMGMIDKVTKVVPMPLGFTIGVMADPMSDGRGLKGSVGFIKDRVTKYKVPSVNTLQWWLTAEQAPNTYKAPIWGGLGLGIGGQILSSLGLHPIIGKVFRPLSKFGYGLFAGAVVGLFAWLGASEGTAYTRTPGHVNQPSEAPTNTNMRIGGYA